MDRVPLSDSESERFLLEEGDLLFARQSLVFSGAGKCSLFVGASEPVTFESHLIRARLDNATADPMFYFYFFQSQAGRHVMETIVEQVAAAGIRGSDLARLPVPIPQVSEQKAIAHILGTLDDKIELNRKMNGTLEAMARAIFKSWFVDFDPVRIKAEAKAQGRSPDADLQQLGLSREIADLFPDEFQDSELGKIPKGWECVALEEVADLAWGDTSVTKKSYTDTGFTAYSAKGPDGMLPYHDFDRTGVVVSAIGANSGATWLASGKWSCIKNTIRFWATDGDAATEYLYHVTKGNDKWPLRGSAQPFISQGDARALRVLVPANGLGKRFGEEVRPLYDSKRQRLDESSVISEVRDALLPRLLSGDVTMLTH